MLIGKAVNCGCQANGMERKNTPRELNLLPPQLYISSPGYFASSIETLTRKPASLSFSNEIGSEGVV